MSFLLVMHVISYKNDVTNYLCNFPVCISRVREGRQSRLKGSVLTAIAKGYLVFLKKYENGVGWSGWQN